MSRSEQEAVVERLLHAVRGGDLQGLLDLQAPDVVVVGGGKVQAAVRPVTGEVKVCQLIALLIDASADLQITPILVNGTVDLRVTRDGQLFGVTGLAIEDGLISRVYSVANPDKLTRLDDEVPLRR